MSRGFTLVELLIVIVVIAILAAISIVAYNGIQQRARNTQTMQAVNSYVKAFKLYQADNGSLPTDTGCLGANFHQISAGMVQTVHGVSIALLIQN